MDHDSANKKNEPAVGRAPNNYLAFAMICTIGCFAPIGIFALFYSLRVNQLWEEKRVLEARKASKIARAISLCTVVVGIIFWLGVLSGAFFNIFGYNKAVSK